MGSTLFFQDSQTIDLLAKHVFPDLQQDQYIKVWDAGCAMGFEPYSIAIILREDMGQLLFRNVRIYATDITGNFDDDIKQGIYPKTALAQMPKNLFDAYFAPNGKPGYFEIRDEILRAVHFLRHDLLSLEPILGDLGLIVCRNVLERFAPAQRVDVVKMFHRALANGGYLVMEPTQKLPRGTENLFRRVGGAAQLFQKVC